VAKAIIGQPFTFTVLFIDASGNPIIPTDPSIYAFYFLNGVKQVLVPAGTPMSAVAGDAGRYAYTATIPASLSPSVEVYSVMECTDPSTAITITTEQEVDLFSAGGGPTPSSGGGLRVSFVKPGAC
jgi:hypothetical protein